MTKKKVSRVQGINVIVNDILIHTQSWDEHVSRLNEVFSRLRKGNLTARLTKCCIGFEEVEFLGHVVHVGHGCVKPKSDKIESSCAINILVETGSTEVTFLVF